MTFPQTSLPAHSVPNHFRDALFHGTFVSHDVLCVFVNVFNVRNPPREAAGPVSSSQLMQLWARLKHRIHKNVCWEMTEFLFLGFIRFVE